MQSGFPSLRYLSGFKDLLFLFLFCMIACRNLLTLAWLCQTHIWNCNPLPCLSLPPACVHCVLFMMPGSMLGTEDCRLSKTGVVTTFSIAVESVVLSTQHPSLILGPCLSLPRSCSSPSQHGVTLFLAIIG